MNRIVIESASFAPPVFAKLLVSGELPVPAGLLISAELPVPARLPVSGGPPVSAEPPVFAEPTEQPGSNKGSRASMATMQNILAITDLNII
jgi:hypothetical protein